MSDDPKDRMMSFKSFENMLFILDENMTEENALNIWNFGQWDNDNDMMSW